MERGGEGHFGPLLRVVEKGSVSCYTAKKVLLNVNLNVLGAFINV